MQAYTVASQGVESEWAPIRIKVSAKDMDDPSRHCTAVGEVSMPDGSKVKCEGKDLLTEAKKDIVLKQLLPAAIKLHAERLSVRPVKGPIRMPYTDIGECSSFTIPSWHHTIGVSGADLILYVNALPANGTVAWASLCVTLEDGRPYAGAVNFDPQYIGATDQNVSTAAHEIGHVLGFSFNHFSRFNMLSKVSNVRGKENVWVVSSPKVKAATWQHYNCPTLEGMELEDGGGEGAKLNHWKERNARGELMSPGEPYMYYSALTLAAFEDMGVYKVNDGMADPLRWGKNYGCGLLENKCIVNGRTDYSDMYCLVVKKGQQGQLCTHDRLSLGICGLMDHLRPFPPEYQYFDYDPTSGGDSELMDYCPYVTGLEASGCINGNPDTFPGSFIGPRSRCVRGRMLEFDRQVISDVCVNTQCSEGKLRVQFLGNDTWHDCNEGTTAAPSGGKWSGGSIRCPRYADVCTDLPSFLARPTPVVAPTTGGGAKPCRHCGRGRRLNQHES
ncbi:leishmanolysin [Trypanosoma rangeli SC58]|uniref:Leishmanolysin-like peptidase n=1 Tax=Trypanosoma rangeli SC58 TaxID=429131 RepID=A0A061J2T4_TRYRA|nr:leishmanolysin [Trypanosoma rangeli SC58]